MKHHLQLILQKSGNQGHYSQIYLAAVLATEINCKRIKREKTVGKKDSLLQAAKGNYLLHENEYIKSKIKSLTLTHTHIHRKIIVLEGYFWVFF